MRTSAPVDYDAVSKAFSKQAQHYDSDDYANPILTDWRKQVYDHVNRFLKPHSFILELNAGTGIDAVHFVKEGHRVHATDLADGMVEKIESKITSHSIPLKLTCQQCSFERLDEVKEKNFDYIFSNFGGLNCVDDLSKVTRYFTSLLKPAGFVTLVIMPPVCPWEWLWLFKGHGESAFRRLSKGGSNACLEGEIFTTYYHSFISIKKAMGKNFKAINSESLGLVSPPPSKGMFPVLHPFLYRGLKRIDSAIAKATPFNRWGDHIIVTFQRTG